MRLDKKSTFGSRTIFNTHIVGNKFHYAGLYIKRANASLFPIFDAHPTLNLLIKSHQSSR